MNRTAMRWSFLAGLGFLLASASAHAAQACNVDTDCPTAACGGEVCDFTMFPTVCKPAGSTGPQGMDGWCNVDSDCKCASMGAKCVGEYCTITKPPGGGGSSGSAGAGAGGSTGSAGSSGSGTGGTATAGSSGTNNGGGGGGCSLAGSPAGAGGLSLSLLGLIAALARRRRV